MNRSDIPTILLSATPTRLISTHLHHPSIFTLDAFPAATLPLYRGLEQAPNMLDCIPVLRLIDKLTRYSKLEVNAQ